MTDALEGKVALVTGGSSGIGRATAEKLCAAGARVVITGRDRQRGNDSLKTLKATGGQARFVVMDAASEESVHAAVEETERQFGGIDFLLNNAGYEGPVAPITDITEEACDRLLAINVKGPLMAAKHAIPRMLGRGGGCIVNVASFLGTIPFPAGAGYGASKAALIHLSRSIAAGYGEQGDSVLRRMSVHHRHADDRSGFRRQSGSPATAHRPQPEWSHRRARRHRRRDLRPLRGRDILSARYGNIG